MLGEPARTQYDLLFRIAGIPVRVSPFFWAVAALLGWNLAVSLDRGLEASPHRALVLGLWILAVFLSILIHELGHALAMRYYGVGSSIVLYHFGGLAIPGGAGAYAPPGRAMRASSQIVIAAAGPAAQLLVAAAVLLLVWAAGYQVLLLRFLVALWPAADAPPIPSLPLHLLATFLILPSVFWALLNLIPVYPLDGGQIAREFLMMFGAERGIRQSLILSLVTGGVVAVYGFMTGSSFLGIMFAMLAFSSYQTLQRYTGGGRGGPTWS